MMNESHKFFTLKKASQIQLKRKELSRITKFINLRKRKRTIVNFCGKEGHYKKNSYHYKKKKDNEKKASDKLISYKDKVLYKFKIYESKIKLHSETFIKFLGKDRRKECYDPYFFKTKGIIHEITPPYTSQ